MFRMVLAFLLASVTAGPVRAQQVAPVRLSAAPALGISAVPGLLSPAARFQAPLLTPSAGSALPLLQVPAALSAVPDIAPVLSAAQAAAPKPFAVKAGLRAVSSRLVQGRGAPAAFRDTLRAAFDGGMGRGDAVPSIAGEGTVLYNGVSLPRRMFTDSMDVGDQIVRAIDAAEEDIELSLLEIGLQKYADALLRAQERGVRIRIVIDQRHMFPDRPGRKRSREAQALLDAGVKMRTLNGTGPYGMMHNKFALFDRKLLETGSFNWSHAANAWHHENALFTDDAHRIRGYTRSWQWQWDQARPVSKKAGKAGRFKAPEGSPPRDTAMPVRFKGVRFPAYVFTPGNISEKWLTKAIENAERSIDLAMFSLTSVELYEALAAARDRGVKVRLLFDMRNAREIKEMWWFVEHGFDVVVSRGRDGERGVMHNKFALFDGELLETGSYNWTQNARDHNFENQNYFDDAQTVLDYAAYFGRIRSAGWRLSMEPVSGLPVLSLPTP